MKPESAQSGLAGALQKIREARLIEAEALSELIAAVKVAESGPSAPTGVHTEGENDGYLSIKQLAARIPYSESTIRNLILAGEFRQDLHFFKRRGRIMFSWRKMQEWIEARKEHKVELIPLVRNRKRGSSS
jgi:hypothetical protein